MEKEGEYRDLQNLDESWWKMKILDLFQFLSIFVTYIIFGVEIQKSFLPARFSLKVIITKRCQKEWVSVIENPSFPWSRRTTSYVTCRWHVSGLRSQGLIAGFCQITPQFIFCSLALPYRWCDDDDILRWSERNILHLSKNGLGCQDEDSWNRVVSLLLILKMSLRDSFPDKGIDLWLLELISKLN